MLMSILINHRFITFEGIDGCGKSTQARMLRDYLEQTGEQVTFVREPGGTLISEAVRGILLDINRAELGDRTEALLMTASRAQLTDEVILPALRNERWIIADRFADSTLAYQGGGRGLDLDWLIHLNKFATADLEPGVTFVIDVNPALGQQRRSAVNDRIEEAGLSFQAKVRDGYREIAERFPERIIVLDGSASIAVIHKQVIKEMTRRKLI